MDMIEHRSFEETFSRLLSGEDFDLYQAGFSDALEIVAHQLFEGVRKDVYYDGVIELVVSPRKSAQIEISGQMWIGGNNSKQWLEDFHARATDKTCTKQGIWVSMKIGDFHSEGSLGKMPDRLGDG